MLSVLNIVLPVFLLIAVGYCAVRFKLYPKSGVPGLIVFVNVIATPVLLFRAMLTADFQTSFDPGVISSFYAGAVVCFLAGMVLARRVFGNSPGLSVSSGFSAAFSNTVLIGIPLIQRAYGDAAMPYVYSIIGLHAPVLMSIGMVVMELARRDGGKVSEALMQAGIRAIKNPLLIGIALGIVCNMAQVKLAEPIDAVTLLMAQAVLPVALFGLGGALIDYRLVENWPQAAAMSALKLLIHPLIAWVMMVPILGIDPAIARIGVLLAAMPCGINAYIFATYYNRGVNVASNAVLISTVGSILSISLWLYLLSL